VSPAFQSVLACRISRQGLPEEHEGLSTPVGDT